MDFYSSYFNCRKNRKYKDTKIYAWYIQSNLSYVTFQRNSEIWSHKAGGRLIQV
jgi:hypothetical protein